MSDKIVSMEVLMKLSPPRDIADLTASDFAVLKEGETHYFRFVQPDEE
jgi:hypothetical protein